MIRKLIVFLFVFSLSVSASFAQPQFISGELSGTLPADSYIVTGDIWVAEFDVLNIEAGSTLTFSGAHSFVIDGTLLCNGTYDAAVTFTDPNYEWLGISCTPDSEPETLFRYTTIENSSDAGLSLNGCAPLIFRCKFQNNAGPGLSLTNNAGPVHVNETLVRNNSGRGIVISGSSSMIMNDSIVENNTGDFGAGISCFSSNLDMTNVDVLDNSCSGFDQDGGGGLYMSSSIIVAIDCDFISNYAYDDDDGASGGAIYSLSGSLTISGCRFIDNSTEAWDIGGHGGAIFGMGTHVIATDCDFIGNSTIAYQHGGAGGAVHIDGSAGNLLDNCNFYNNHASGELAAGGALYLASFVNSDVTHCEFTNNTTDIQGGAIMIESGFALRFTNLSFAGNIAGDTGEAIHLSNTTLNFANSVVAHHDGGAIQVGQNSLVIASFNDFYGNLQDHITGNIPFGFGVISQSNGNGDPCDEAYNIFLDPQLVNYQDNDLRLHPASPCINAGDPDDDPDPDGSIVDIGAISLSTESMELTLRPDQVRVSAGGGTVVYDITLMSNVAVAFPALRYAETVELPDGTMAQGFVHNITFPFAAFGNTTVEGFTIDVPSYAPGGWYELQAYVGLSPAQIGATNTLAFYKDPGMVMTRDLVDASEFIAGSHRTIIADPSTSSIPEVPAEFTLYAPYPNPFNEQTRIVFELPNSTQVRVEIFDIQGRLVHTLYDGYLEAGLSEFNFTAADYASGLYFVMVETADSVRQIRKLTLLK
jgi:Right handed beta helix region/Secretion system C-terminal sorting domain/Chlamydia polymorphic membrane protein (Chlamydia_PMP) repeat